MPNFWRGFWNRFHHPKIKTIDVVITLRDKQHHHDSAIAQFELKEKRQSWL